MPSYSSLNQRHPSWNESRQCELRGLYEGGEKLERLYPTILPRRDRERPQRYEVRLKEAQYRNYLGPIIDYFASMLFVSRTVSKATLDEKLVEDPGEYWTKFRDDCDREGTDLDDLLKFVLTDAMVCGHGWIRLHQPAPSEEPVTNVADFERLGLGDCWLEHLEPSAVLDWDASDDGRMLWAVTHELTAKRRGLGGDRKLITETWQHLTPEAVETYAITYESDKRPKPDDEVPLVGAPVPHRFGLVPLVCLELPSALWVANRLRSPQLAHFRKTNALAWSLATSCYAMRQYFVGSPEEFSKVVNGAGYEIVLGIDEKAEWDAPPTDHFSALDTEIKAEKDEIFRIAHQMALGVDNNAAAVGRTAESKASDLQSTRVVLVAISRIVRETIEYTLDLISGARGEEFTWSVEGLDDFAALDAAAFVENLKLLNDAGRTIPSKTFQIAVNERTAELFLPHLDEQTKTKIREEIRDGTTDPAEDARLDRELELASAAALFGGAEGEAPAGTERPGEDPPAPKPPTGGDRGRPKKR
ncbi:MAG TPA: hypothetical protein VFR23_24795 [Jiangellaceae bacterium]|nr:hypothetical protein [Jiangellaceae bacterium]